MPQFPDDHKRVLAATIGDIRFVCFYVPNGQSVGSDKYQYKLRWLTAATAYLREELARHPRLAVVGDINIAPRIATCTTGLWRGQVLYTDAERGLFAGWLALGFKDSFRFRPAAQDFQRAGGINACSRSPRTMACASTTSCSPAPAGARVLRRPGAAQQEALRSRTGAGRTDRLATLSAGW
jgi:hypothetical protein